MTPDTFLRTLAARTLDLTDDERDGLMTCIERDLCNVMRVRQQKGDAPTLPPPAEDDRAVPVSVSRAAMNTIPEVE